MVVVVPGLAAFDNGRSARSAVGSLATISGVPSFAIFTSKALSIARASSEVRVFFSGSMRRAQTSSGSRAVNAASSPRRRPQRRTEAQSGSTGIGPGRENFRCGLVKGGDDWNGRIPVHLPRRGWLVAVLLELAPDDRQVRSIKVILTSDADKREQAIASGVGQGRSHMLGRCRICDWADRPIGRDPLSGCVGEDRRQSHESGLGIDRGRLHRRYLMPAKAFTHEIKPAREGGIAKDTVARRRDPRRVPVSDFSGFVSSSWAWAAPPLSRRSLH